MAEFDLAKLMKQASESNDRERIEYINIQDMDDRSNLENVWRQYHALGGNGDMNDLRRTFRHLPMAKDGAPMIINENEGDGFQ